LNQVLFKQKLKTEFAVFYIVRQPFYFTSTVKLRGKSRKVSRVTRFLQFSTSSLSYRDALRDIKFQCTFLSFSMRHALVAGYSMISHKKTAVIGILNMFFIFAAWSFCNALHDPAWLGCKITICRLLHA